MDAFNGRVKVILGVSSSLVGKCKWYVRVSVSVQPSKNKFLIEIFNLTLLDGLVAKVVPFCDNFGIRSYRLSSSFDRGF